MKTSVSGLLHKLLKHCNALIFVMETLDEYIQKKKGEYCTHRG